MSLGLAAGSFAIRTGQQGWLSPAVGSTRVGLVVTYYSLLGLRTPNVYLHTEHTQIDLADAHLATKIKPLYIL